MKTLIINGSPRGEQSNTLRISRAFAKGLGGDVTEFTVSRENITPCRGCFSCWGKTAGKCVIEDAVGGLIESIMEADTVIESFPLYFCGMPGQMKLLADRLLPLTLPFIGKPMPQKGEAFVRLRYSEVLKQKKLAVISTCGYGQTEGMFDGLRAQYDAVCGSEGYIPIFVPQGELYGFPSLSPQIERRLGLAEKAGAELGAEGRISEETAKALTSVLIPNRALERIALAGWDGRG